MSTTDRGTKFQFALKLLWCWLPYSRTFILTIFIAGCASTPPEYLQPTLNANTPKIFVVGNRRHIGIVFDTQFLKEQHWSEFSTLKSMHYIEAGWGDKNHATVKGTPGIFTTLSALFFRTDGIIQLTGFNQRPDYFNRNSFREWRAIPVTEIQLEQIVKLIDSKLARNNQNEVMKIHPAKWGNGAMYASKEKYSLANLCGSWVHSLLAIANIPPPPPNTLRPRSLMKHLRQYSRPYEPPPSYSYNKR